MSNKNYENQILDAIQTLVDNAVSKASYDKTIKGVISKCTNQSIGEYVIKYQDSSFYAYSNDLNQIYNSGTPVYVLVPGNDMAQTKTILGSVNKLGNDYISIKDSTNDYQVIGNSIISADSEFGVCSYLPDGDAIVLYDKINDISLIDVNEFAANAYLKQANYLIVGGKFRTNLTSEQKYKGNYGLAFKLNFLDVITNENVSRTYLVDVNAMIGNPYNYTSGSEQKVVFEIDGANFQEIESITLFCYDFPNTSEDVKPDDIFVSNFIMNGANALTEEELGGNVLTLITPQGIYFDNNDTSTASREINAEVKIDNKIINANSNVLQYYWFRENPTITSASLLYNRYGGNGWECLNNYNNLGNNEAGTPIIDWLSAQASYKITKASNSAKETDYKCIVVYNNELVLSKTFTIYNYSSAYTITIDSDSGTYFNYNNGKPTLTARVNGEVSNDYTYIWSAIDNNNRFSTIAQTNDLNTDYNTKKTRYEEIKSGLSDGSILLTPAIQTELSDLMYALQQYEVTMRVEDNIIYNLNLNTVTNFSTFICSVYNNGDYIGKGKIQIVNDISGGANAYTLVINNGDQIFKYNEQGVAPTSKSLENPQVIYPLSFTLFDENGLEVSANAISANDVYWTVPTTSTMISIPDTYGNPSEIDNINETKTYNGYKELTFNIPTLFSANKERNSIELKVKYKDKAIIAKTDLTFLKEGEVGTNGTNFVCKIVPNVMPNTEAPKYVIYRYNNTTSVGNLNYTPAGEGLWFKAQLYKDGIEIYSGNASGTTTEDKTITIEWNMLINKYDRTHSDVSNFEVTKDGNNYLFSFIDANKNISNPANIVKCTIIYENQTYYATIPIIYVNAAAAYKAELIEDTGFLSAMYTADGERPAYDNSNPFALKVVQTINNIDTDISIATDSQYAIDYDWNVQGQIYSGDQWITQTNLIQQTSSLEILAHNQIKFKPIDRFDGFCVNNGLLCSITRNENVLLTIHIPIHLYLNRYGNAALNGWDGNHIEINDDGGFILAPQIGAGKKENDNSYTGVFMGNVREAGSSSEDVGLFGYNQGVRTIELNAEDGSAKFGKAGAGQIIISPDETSAHSILKSGNYIPPTLDDQGNVVIPGSGLEIDLTDPHITFGSGNFRVDANGQISATGIATISQLESGDYNIPGVDNFKIESATDTVQFETDTNHYPSSNITKTIICTAFYKDIATSNYTATIVDANGNTIANGTNVGGIIISISKNQSITTISFTAASTRIITNTINEFFIKYIYNNTDILTKAYYANLVIKGQDGSKGDPGPAGPAGKDGTSVVIKGSYSTLSELITAHPSGNTLGDGYVVGLDLYVYTNAAGGGGSLQGDWNNVGQFKGEDAKRCFIVASSEVFKSTDNGATYIPASATITPYLQSVTFSSWAYDKNDGSGYRPLTETLPTGISINNNIITIQNNSEVFNSTDTVLFKCTTNNNEVYDIITITRVKDGVDGKGISSITNYYLATNASSGVTRETTGWTTAIQTMTATNQYLWSYEEILYTNNTYTYTNPIIIGRYGQNGATGKGISSIVEYYAINNSTTAPADNDFSTTVVSPTSTNKYLWNYELITYSNPASTSKTDKRIIGTYGRDGANGKSVIVDTTTITYQNSTSGTTIPSGTWTSNPNPEEGKYTWIKTVTTYKLEGTSTSAGNSTSYSVAYTGPKGDQGKSLVKQTPLYYLKSNDTAPQAPNSHVTSASTEPGIWTTAMPIYINGYTYFTCSENEFNEAPFYNWTPVIKENGLNNALNIAEAAYAKSALFWYTVTDTADAPDDIDEADWVSNLPSAPNQYIWQRIEYRFLNSEDNYFSDPTCLYTPTRITNQLQYCLCTTSNYTPEAIAPEGNWRSEPYPWDDSYYSSTGVGNITINRYQFIRNMYIDANKEGDDAISYSVEVLDQSWYMFGLKIATEKVARETLESNINNNIVTMNSQTGLTISNADKTYGIRLTSVGMQFLINNDWRTVWNINGALDASLITVNDLKAENILSGTFTLKSAENAGKFIFDTNGNISLKIDENGIKVITTSSTPEWEATGSSVEIKSNTSGGISAKTSSNEEYFNISPKTQQTTMTNTQINNALGLGDYIKVVKTNTGIAFIGIYSDES